MRIFPILAIVSAFACGDLQPAAAQPTDACKRCRDEYQRCMKNYSGKTCKTELDICLKGCRQK
jgi:hypothetical protein